MSEANSVQIGGEHYKADADKARRAAIVAKITKGEPLEHWDIVFLMGWDYFQGCATKYIHRYRGKNGVQDIDKGIHFMQKMRELVVSESEVRAEDEARIAQEALQAAPGPRRRKTLP